jgi:serine O-acetyltransferase
MIHKIDDLLESMLDSCETIGGINHLEGPNLPSRQSVCGIVDDLESLIFPGFRDEADLERLNLRYILGGKITKIIKSLINETEKSLRYMCKIQDQCERLGQCRAEAEDRILRIMGKIAEIRQRVSLDLQAAFNGDPAAKSHEEIILSYPGIEAIMIHRIAHEFWLEEIPLIPRMMSEYIHSKTGIDIHPGAQIGEYFFIDHGTGVVIGETTVIGNNVKIYHGVTLGAKSVRKEDGNKKRHPTIEDDVIIYPGATILGGETVIGKGSIVGGNVWLLSSVPPYSMVYYKPEISVMNKKGGWDSPDYQI